MARRRTHSFKLPLGTYCPSWTQRGYPMSSNQRRVFVDPTTGEERSPSPGEPRFMIVELRGDGFEYVKMANVVVKDLWGYEIVVPPHGKGWKRFDTSSDKWWVWRRANSL